MRKKSKQTVLGFRPLKQTWADLVIITNYLRQMFPGVNRTGAIIYALSDVAARIKKGEK